MEEERLRNPMAQGLPYTTDEPEVWQRRLVNFSSVVTWILLAHRRVIMYSCCDNAYMIFFMYHDQPKNISGGVLITTEPMSTFL